MAGGENHPTPAELERFMIGELPPGDSGAVMAHLLRGCDRCRETVAPLAAAMFAPGQDAGPALWDESEYDLPLFRAFASAQRYADSLGEQQSETLREIDGLLLHQAPAQPPAPAARARRDRARCEELLQRSRTLRHRDLESAVQLAGLAAGMAERLDPDAFDPAALADFQARAWGEVGNARRVADDPAGAESDLARALARAEEGTGDPALLARLMDLTASLLTDQRRFGDAARLLDGVYRLHERQGDAHAAGRALISKGVSTGYALDLEQAIRLLARGLARIDAARDPELVLSAVHSLIAFLVDGGRFAEAERLVAIARPLYTAHGDRLLALKVRWVEGKIAAGSADDDRAEESFCAVRAGFEQAGLPYDAALVSLDLAAIWLRRGRTAEIRRLVDETVAVFRARHIRREAIGAMLVLREAIEKDRATLALLRTVAAELQPARRLGDRR
jgi:hypothetical protein